MSLLGREILLDTGPLVALLDQRDQAHGAARERWPRMEAFMLTTEAVLTEATHVASRGGGQHWRPLAALLDGHIPIMALHLPAHERCLGLMRKYDDLKMDYADASLIVLGEAIGAKQVFTLDRAFDIYRGASGTRFEVVSP